MISALATLWSARATLTAALIAGVIGFHAGRIAGHSQGYRAATQSLQHVQIVEEKHHAQNLQNLRRLDDNALVRRYCRWVYDLPYGRCVRTLKPVE